MDGHIHPAWPSCIVLLPPSPRAPPAPCQVFSGLLSLLTLKCYTSGDPSPCPQPRTSLARTSPQSHGAWPQHVLPRPPATQEAPRPVEATVCRCTCACHAGLQLASSRGALPVGSAKPDWSEDPGRQHDWEQGPGGQPPEQVSVHM